MMIKLKYITLSLFISFLGFIGFSNAGYTLSGYFYIGDTRDIYVSKNNNYSINNIGDFLTNGENLFYWVTDTYNNNTRNYSYSWLNGNLYFLFSYNDTLTGSQYIIDKWCIVPTSTRDFNSSMFHSDCVYSHSTDEVKQRVSSFSEYIVGVVGTSSPIWTNNNNQPLLLCLSDGDFDYCVSCSSLSSNCPSGSTGLNLSFTDGSFNSLSSYNWSNSPLGGGGYGTGSEVIIWSGHKNLNRNYYDIFKYVGYYSGLCYGDYLLSSVVDSNTDYYDMFLTDLDDGEAYTGADVFTLSRNWLSNLNMSFGNYITNSRVVYNTVRNNPDRLHIYDGVSKGHFYFMMKLENTDFIDSYSFNSTDLYSFCNFVVNGYSPNSIFTGSVSSNLLDIKTNYEYLQQNSSDFILSGSGEGFEDGTSIFDVFNLMYTKLKSFFPIDERLSSYSVGFLPSYIIGGFFLFLCFYILRR